MTPLAANDDFALADLCAAQAREIAATLSARLALGAPSAEAFGAAVRALARGAADTLSDPYRSPRKEQHHG